MMLTYRGARGPHENESFLEVCLRKDRKIDNYLHTYMLVKVNYLSTSENIILN